MFGKLLEAVVKTATLPVDVVCDAVNVITVSDKDIGENTLNKIKSIEETLSWLGNIK